MYEYNILNFRQIKYTKIILNCLKNLIKWQSVPSKGVFFFLLKKKGHKIK